jgi:hypothetical protein
LGKRILIFLVAGRSIGISGRMKVAQALQRSWRRMLERRDQLGREAAIGGRKGSWEIW